MNEGIEIVAKLMVLAAQTSPKTGGKSYLVTKILTGEEINKLAAAMESYGQQKGKDFSRDAGNVRQSLAVVLIGLDKAANVGLNCGACGYSQCELKKLQEGPEFSGPLCAWRLIDLGIALGSAVKVASMLNVDNRIMYRIGVAARQAKFLEGEVMVGIPLSASEKNIYFDRPVK